MHCVWVLHFEFVRGFVEFEVLGFWEGVQVMKGLKFGKERGGGGGFLRVSS